MSFSETEFEEAGGKREDYMNIDDMASILMKIGELHQAIDNLQISEAQARERLRALEITVEQHGLHVNGEWDDVCRRLADIEEAILKIPPPGSWSTPFGWVPQSGIKLARWISGVLVSVVLLITSSAGWMIWDSHERLIRVESFSLVGPRATAEDLLLVVLADLDECKRLSLAHPEDPIIRCDNSRVRELEVLASNLRARIERAHQKH